MFRSILVSSVCETSGDRSRRLGGAARGHCAGSGDAPIAGHAPIGGRPLGGFRAGCNDRVRSRGKARHLLFATAIAILAVATIAPMEVTAEPPGLQLSGSLLTDASLLQSFAGQGSQPSLSPGGFSQFTLNFVNTKRQFAKVAGSAVMTLSYGGYADAYRAAVSQIVGPAEPGLFALLSSNGAAVQVDLRQLYLAIYTPLADLSMGRQIVSFGVGTFFSPIDAFTEPTLSDLNYIRSGSDVVRIDAGFGELSGLEAVSTVTDSADTLTSALKLYTNLAGVDLAGVVMYRGTRDELLAGVDFKGDLLLGVYGEAVEHFSLASQARWFEGMLGADYSFGDQLFLTLEGYYNGNPVAVGSLNAAQIASAGSLFLNEYYLYFASRLVLNDLMSLQASLIYDFSANALLPTLQYRYNIVQNANLIVYGRYFGGNIQAGGLWPGPDLQYGMEAQVAF